MAMQDFDVLIIGAGLSGIGAACHLTRSGQARRFAILERRQDLGGTWDLFRYPGIRSDSDMTTFGYAFKPWKQPRVLADGASIKQYIGETAAEHGVLSKIHYGRRVTQAEWCSDAARWTLTVTRDNGDTETWRAAHVVNATGYYNYDQGHAPDFPGQDRFKGEIVHPQFWPEDLDVADKRMVVIGSGATAITLVPSLAKRGAQVTMLQRTPTWVLSVPAIDPLWNSLSRLLPERAVFAATRARNIALQRAIYVAARKRPAVVRRFLRKMTRRQLGDAVDVRHFTPDYNPWDQRLCVVPDGDLFRVLRRGDADILTDTVDHFDADGIVLGSGKRVDADIIVSATGLDIQLFGGAQLLVDGQAVNVGECMVYKGMLLEGVPNMLTVTGYTNASWTLKADIVCEHYCRILRHMDRTGQAIVVPQAHGVQRLEDTVMGSLDSGYVKRGADRLPRQGDAAPWQLMNDYLRDAAALKLGRIKHRDLVFRPAGVRASPHGPQAAQASMAA